MELWVTEGINRCPLTAGICADMAGGYGNRDLR
jgi:hypothetical protein